MPSPLTRIPRTSRGLVTNGICAALLVCAGLAALAVAGCHGGRLASSARRDGRAYPPTPQVPRVIALGNLRGTPPPSQAEVELSQFLFGVEPPPLLTIANPTGLTAGTDCVLICDATLDIVLRWNVSSGELVEACEHPSFDHPFAIDIAPGGERFVCDRTGVLRCDSQGNVKCSYRPDSDGFKPAGVVSVGDTVWVSNDALHRIEVFDAASGRHLRSIGALGSGPGEFNLPRSLARGPTGNVYIVDMLNNRVQVLDQDGNWLRNIGRPGDSVGSFGRPKDVAIGPDGTVFVTDAFSQRVHAFAPDGQPLLAFGEPGSGAGELTLPNGIAVTALTPRTDHELPPDVIPEYYVLVAEQMNRPGVRAYAWLGACDDEPAPFLSSDGRVGRSHPSSTSTVANPHWITDGCSSCHQIEDGQPVPIAREKVDAICMSCHDGVKASADPHPIGRAATGELVATPTDWPTIDGTITCLTCHDLSPQCTANGKRPAVNYLLLRDYDPQQPLAYCSNCHLADVSGRFSPHQQRDATGRIRDDACFFCHAERPKVPPDGRRRFEPKLRVESSELCLNCHSRHWDLSPLGHVDRPVTPRIRQWMLMRELSLENGGDPRELARLAAESDRDPARLPLGENRVTCYTCHNPHYTGLFPPDSELGAIAENPQDRVSALRANWVDLCSECHSR